MCADGEPPFKGFPRSGSVGTVNTRRLLSNPPGETKAKHSRPPDLPHQPFPSAPVASRLV